MDTITLEDLKAIADLNRPTKMDIRLRNLEAILDDVAKWADSPDMAGTTIQAQNRLRAILNRA